MSYKNHQLSTNKNGNDEYNVNDDDDDVLGSGSFSDVTRLTIKLDVLPSRLTEYSSKYGSIAAFIKAATEPSREACLLSRFDHPHIINDMGWTDGGVASYYNYRRYDAFFLVLELLQEETRHSRIESPKDGIKTMCNCNK